MHLSEINLSDIEGFWTEPMAVREAAFETLRREDPIRFFPEAETEYLAAGPGYYALTKHADIVAASRQANVFQSGAGTNIPDLPPEFNEFFGSMINMDDPRHARLRKLVSAGFTPRMLQRNIEDVDAAAKTIVHRLQEAGPGCDFVTACAAWLPVKIICDMMGIPESQHEFVFDMTNIILSQGDPEFVPEGQNPLEAFLGAGAALAGLIDDIAGQADGSDGDTLTHALVNAEIDGDKLTREEIQSFFVLLCAAGNETTRNSISWGLTYLTANAEQKALLQSDLDTHMPGAVEEIVRHASPVIHFRRTVTQDGARLGDTVFNEGDKVVLFYGSGNRDDAVFDDPYAFDITRDNTNHIGFGGPGPHFCLGAHLARRQINVLYKELLSQMPDIHAVGEPDRLRSSFINGVKHLECAW
ncbi:MAG: cytochrome P450 [Actinobacteria bacterium]|jgi:cytochrome P450|nr:cytochrome P450 [Actinomycetota bacterium]